LLAREALVKKERLAAIGEMASVVSHELKTPLAVIQNSAYFLENRLTEHPDPKIQKHIGIINSQTRSLNNIISGILDYTRSRDLRLEAVRVNDLVADLAAVVPIPSNIRVRLQLSEDVPSGVFDREELRQALTNLINNAVQSMPEGGELEIHTGRGADGCVDIRVTDSGCGIPRENMSRIFQPFFTTKSEGTGLGMAIVKRVVDRHKGKIQVQSSPGKGTTITLSLPSTYLS
jgi:signal transduction histidine kinase